MKRVLMCVLVCVMIISISFSQITVFAANSTYRIEEAKLELTIPSGYTVITRNTSSDAEIFSRLGLSYSEYMNSMKSSDVYLNAVSDSHSEEVVVTSKENILNDFTRLGDTTLKSMASGLIDEFDKRGVSVIKYDIYQHAQAKFIRIYWIDTANSRYGLQYYTVHNGNAMNFTLSSYEGSITSRQESVMKTIVDSVKYDNASPDLDDGEDTDAFVYTDSESGVEFTVPANWKQDEFTEDMEYLTAKFASTKEDGCIIIFSGMDAWVELPTIEKIGLSREDVDNSIFTKADVAQMYNTTEDDVLMVTYNGVEYYKCEITTTKEAYGLSFDITMTQLLLVDNGWMYAFQFNGTEDHKLYSDFEELVRSVQYPSGEIFENDDDEIPSYIADTEDDNSQYLNDNFGATVFGVILVIAGIVAVVFLIKRINKSKRPSGTVATVYCRKCGQALSHDSDFCHTCGTKVEKENEL